MAATATKSKPKSQTKVTLQPLGDKVVVEREESQEKTAGGILHPRRRQGQAHPRHDHRRRHRQAARRRHPRRDASQEGRPRPVHQLRPRRRSRSTTRNTCS